MPKFCYYLTEKTSLYKEIEAINREEADQIIDEFMSSDHIDWGMGSMEYEFEFDGEIKDA